jgi:hypothetical protein
MEGHEMQFVKNGPNVPEVLLQAHEEGRVVFFCGAGISYPAGLPGFEGLVNEICHIIGTKLKPNEEEAYNRKQFEVTLGLLERRLPGQRLAIERALRKALRPQLQRKKSLETHKALLQLAHNRKDEALRLVTSNFDGLFEIAAKRSKRKISTRVAPLLPIPNNCWNGLVYLHGRLEEQVNKIPQNNLVFTSADFGRAYLIEQWAAHFVRDLFKNYIVCFIGYSVNDPVIRYMVDAVAADQGQNEEILQIYAFGDCKSDKEKIETDKWKVKGIKPILYSSDKEHSALHRTLIEWARIYRDGIRAKESIIKKYALRQPSDNTKRDDFVGRLLWALSDISGIPAKRFAEFEPPPPLEWLEVFSENRYRHNDLVLFGVQPDSKVNTELSFSFINHPAPYSYAPWMSMTYFKSKQDTHWDDVMFYIARWLSRHLYDTALILWLAEHGYRQQDRLLQIIDDRITRLESENKDESIAQIQDNIKSSVQPLIRVLWRLFLSGRVKTKASSNEPNIYRWKRRLIRDGFSVTLRLELRDLLAPKVLLSKPLRWLSYNENVNDPEHPWHNISYELVLTANNVQGFLSDIVKIDVWNDVLTTMLNDFQHLLRDALDLLSELGEADEYNDRSQSALPSISQHWQNRYSSDWGALIGLLRDAWLSVREHDLKRSMQIAQEWFSLPYPTFKRLALFAASQDNCIAGTQWVDWLATDDARWLWSSCTHRETMRLLVKQGATLTSDNRIKLEKLILAGPPRKMYREDIDPEILRNLVDNKIWLCLAKLQIGGSQLSTFAMRRFENISTTNGWKLSHEERDEFLIWRSGTGAPGFESIRAKIRVPRKREELITWLTQERSDYYSDHADAWHLFSGNNPAKACWALRKLALEKEWFCEFWDKTIYALSEKRHIKRLFKLFVLFIIEKMPDDILLNLAGSVTNWLRSKTQTMLICEGERELFFELCRRVLKLRYKGEEDRVHSLSQAFTHPIGQVTKALLNIWLQSKPRDNDKLPNDIKDFFSHLCDTKVKWFCYGRSLLASCLIELFRVDRLWTKKHLLPIFDWITNHSEAQAVWEGFLIDSCLYKPLLISFKKQFLNTACYCEELSIDAKRHFSKLLTYAALNNIDGYTISDFHDAVEKLPQEALEFILKTLTHALEISGEHSKEYWENCILPFWQNIWPKHRERMSMEITRLIALLSIAARDEFPTAIAVFEDWFQKIDYSYNVATHLNEEELARKFPEDTLKLLDAIIDTKSWDIEGLKECLDTISLAAPQLKNDPRYIKLLNH